MTLSYNNTLLENLNTATGLLATETTLLDIKTSVELIDDTVAILGTTQYLEDTTKGLIIGAVRNDIQSSLVSANGDISPLQVNATGALVVSSTGSSHDVVLTDVNIPSQTTTLNVTANAGTDLNTSALNLQSTQLTINTNIATIAGDTTSLDTKLITGAQTTANSLAVTLATDESALSVISSTLALETTQTTIAGDTTSLDTKLITGAQTTANSLAVTLATDESTLSIIGTVTANAGTDLNTSLLALETTQTDVKNAVELIDDTVSTLGITTYMEATTKGLIIGAVRNNAGGTLVNTDNEIAPLQVDTNGALYVNAGSLGVTQYDTDTVLAVPASTILLGVVRADVVTADITEANGDVAIMRVNNKGLLHTTNQTIIDQGSGFLTTTKMSLVGCRRLDADEQPGFPNDTMGFLTLDNNGFLKTRPNTNPYRQAPITLFDIIFRESFLFNKNDIIWRELLDSGTGGVANYNASSRTVEIVNDQINASSVSFRTYKRLSYYDGQVMRVKITCSPVLNNVSSLVCKWGYWADSDEGAWFEWSSARFRIGYTAGGATQTVQDNLFNLDTVNGGSVTDNPSGMIYRENNQNSHFIEMNSELGRVRWGLLFDNKIIWIHEYITENNDIINDPFIQNPNLPIKVFCDMPASATLMKFQLHGCSFSRQGGQIENLPLKIRSYYMPTDQNRTFAAGVHALIGLELKSSANNKNAIVNIKAFSQFPTTSIEHYAFSLRIGVTVNNLVGMTVLSQPSSSCNILQGVDSTHTVTGGIICQSWLAENDSSQPLQNIVVLQNIFNQVTEDQPVFLCLESLISGNLDILAGITWSEE